jgi:hypothetical protein
VSALAELYQEEHNAHCVLITVVGNVIRKIGRPVDYATSAGYAAHLLLRIGWLAHGIEQAALAGDPDLCEVLVRVARNTDLLAP